MPYPEGFLSNRSVFEPGKYAVITPEGRVVNTIPGIEHCAMTILASPKLGAGFVQMIGTVSNEEKEQGQADYTHNPALTRIFPLFPFFPAPHPSGCIQKKARAPEKTSEAAGPHIKFPLPTSKGRTHPRKHTVFPCGHNPGSVADLHHPSIPEPAA